MTVLIDVRDVTKIHGRGPGSVEALRGVTCEIEEGAFAFILGPSGSGKSTLLYLIGALDGPTSGAITVGGRDLAAMTRSERNDFRRKDVGFVFQSFNLLPNLSALENVLVPFLPRGLTPAVRREAAALLGRVGLSERLEHRPSQLSGGEQQRVAIARALLKRPALVLADEPTGELDSVNGAEILSELRALCREHHSTVVVVTHDQSHLQRGDHVLQIRDGRLAPQGQPLSPISA